MNGVNFFLRMRDRVSRVARRVQGRLGRLERQTQRLQGRLSNLGGGLPMNVGGAAAAALSFGLVKLASDANELDNRFNKLFTDGATSRVNEMTLELKTLGDQVKRGQMDLRGYASKFQSLGQGLGFTFDEATQLSGSLTRLGIDLSSYFNLAGGDAEAVQRLTSGLKGNHEALEAFDVFISGSSLDTRLKTMFGVGTSAATEQQKAMARLAIVMESTNKAHGDAAATAGQFANSYRGLLSQGKDVAASFGQLLLPLFARGLTLLDGFRQRLEGFSKGQKIATLAVAGFVLAGVPMLATLGFMISALGVLVSPIGLAVAGVMALGAAAVYAYNRFEWFKVVVDALARFYLAQWRMIGRAAGFYLETTVTFLRWFASFVYGVGSGLYRGFEGGLGRLRTMWATFASWLPTSFESALTFLRNLPSEMQRMGGEMIAGLKRGIDARIGEVKASITGVGDEITGRFRSLLGIQSPSRVFMSYGRMIPAGLEKGIQKGLGETTLSPQLSAALPNPVQQRSARSRGGGVGAITIHVNGAHRPEETARAVRDELTDLFSSLGLELGVSA